MNKQKKRFIPIIVVLIVLALIGISYYLKTCSGKCAMSGYLFGSCSIYAISPE